MKSIFTSSLLVIATMLGTSMVAAVWTDADKAIYTTNCTEGDPGFANTANTGCMEAYPGQAACCAKIIPYQRVENSTNVLFTTCMTKS